MKVTMKLGNLVLWPTVEGVCALHSPFGDFLSFYLAECLDSTPCFGFDSWIWLWSVPPSG